jgi:hypothetical protein
MMPFQDQSGSRQQEKPREIQQKAKTLTDDVAELFDLYYKLAVVTVTEKASNAASVSVTVIIVLFFFMFTLLFAGLGLGWYLGELLKSVLAGYAIVSAIFGILIAVVLFLRRKVIFPFIRNTIIKRIYEQ